MACGKPADFGLVHRQTWTLDALHACFVAHHRDVEISRTSVFRILSAASVRPHRVRLWLHSPDPQFREKVAEICELYLNPPEGGVVLCVDEKPGMQALGRKHPFKLPGPERDGRWEFEYKRNGTRVLLAAFNPHTGDVYAEVRARRTGRDLVEFMQAVGRRYKGKQIHVIWDNLNIHYDGKEERWSKFTDVAETGSTSTTRQSTHRGRTRWSCSSRSFNCCVARPVAVVVAPAMAVAGRGVGGPPGSRAWARDGFGPDRCVASRTPRTGDAGGGAGAGGPRVTLPGEVEFEPQVGMQLMQLFRRGDRRLGRGIGGGRRRWAPGGRGGQCSG